MISYKNGVVNKIIESNNGVNWIEVNIDGESFKAVNYMGLTGDVRLGDSVVLNTTAMDLSLGTGGYHFVIYNHSNPSMELSGKGHIVKLRYTPYQMACLSSEEENSPHHNVYKEFKSLDQHPVIIATLHSMVAPISGMIKYLNRDIKINYIMTDNGALPIAFSKTISDLKEKSIIKGTITIGHGFGGDLECVNIYTGLIAAKEIFKGDITIVSMGPGIVGTGTKYGFSGIEQGNHINAVNNLGGRSITVPRIGFKDTRSRHRGISHHTLTVLSEITNTKSNLIIPKLIDKKMDYIKNQIKELEIQNKHKVIIEKGDGIQEALEYYNLATTTMGRGIKEDMEYFMTLGAVGRYATKILM